MHALHIRRASAFLVLVVAALLVPNTVSSHAALAHAPGQVRMFRVTADGVTPTAQPGNPTPPPEVSVTTSYTGPCDFHDIAVTLSIANISANPVTNTPSDTTLVVHVALGQQTGALTIQPGSVSSSFGSGGGYTPTADGTGFSLRLGVIPAGANGQVSFTLLPNGLPTARTTIGYIDAQVSEVGGSGEVLSAGAPPTPIVIENYCPTPIIPTPTNTSNAPTATNTPTSTSTQSGGLGAPAATPTSTNTPVPPTATNTPAPPAQVAAVVAPSTTPIVPPSMTPIVAPSTTPIVAASATPMIAPSATPMVAPSGTPRDITVTVYKNATHIRTVNRYRTITRYHDRTLMRYRTLTRYQTLFKTVVRYKTLRRVHVVEALRVVVNHKTMVRHVTQIVVHTVIQRRTIVSRVYAVRVQGHPKTGRFAALSRQAPRGPMPVANTYISLPRLGVWVAPVWTRGYTNDGYGGFTYDIVPYYGVTRFAYSVPFGMPGTTIAYGHDDIYGSIFRYLPSMRTGDKIMVVQGIKRFTYVVRSVSTVIPTDVSLLNAPRATPTLALISCTPYWVDTHRVVVLADLVK